MKQNENNILTDEQTALVERFGLEATIIILEKDLEIAKLERELSHEKRKFYRNVTEGLARMDGASSK